MSETVNIAATESRSEREAASSMRGFAGLIFVGLCVIVVLAPLPLGSARPLAWDILALAVALILLTTLFLPTSETSIARESLSLPVALFGIVICVAILQTVSDVPASLRNPIWDQAYDMLGNNVRGSIAVDRAVTLTYVLRLLLYVGIFYLSVITGRNQHRARTGVWVVALSGCVYGIYGLLVYWSGNRSILWFPKWAYLRDVTGPFVNHNSFATYLGLCALAALALALELFARIELRGDFRRKFVTAVEFMTRHKSMPFMVFILVTALLLTHSRGGLAATIAGAVILLLSIALAPGASRLRRVGAWSIGTGVLVLLIPVIISGHTTLDRFVGADIDPSTHLVVDQLTLQAIRDYPFLGIGLGSFASVFPIYRTAAITGYFDLAHNDYLQNLLELGIPAALCLFTAIACLVTKCILGIRTRRRDAIFPCLGVAASILVGLHATVDFSLQIPAVTAVYLFLLGIAVAQSFSSREPVPKTSAGR